MTYSTNSSWYDEVERTQHYDKERHFERVCNFLKVNTPGFITTKTFPLDLPVFTSVEELEDLPLLICKEVFNTPVRQTDVTKSIWFCQFFGYLNSTNTHHKSDQTVAFEEKLTTIFLNKLDQRFSYRERLYDLVKTRNIPHDKKIKWINRCSEIQIPQLKETDTKSINFLCGLNKCSPEIVHKAIEVLLKCNTHDATEYLGKLLKAIKQQNWRSVKMITQNVHREDWRTLQPNLLHSLGRIAEGNEVVQELTDVKVLLKEFLFTSLCEKYNYPEDHVKKSINRDLSSVGWRRENYFEEDSE